MRLLKRSPDGGFELASFSDDSLPPYAILSHTWAVDQEVTYNELVAGTGKDKAGYEKLRFCVDRADNDGLEYSWVDTCCIDKSSSAELSEAVNSMFRWYQRAKKCYAYLSDVEIPDEVDGQVFQMPWKTALRQSRWFTRGWTLQELLAPRTVEFFSKEGRLLGSRMSLEQDIYEVTKVPVEALRGQRLSEFSVEERMRWAADRITTLEEDGVYCLLGVFGVFLPLIYGEGKAYATLRLQEEIQKRQKGQGMEYVHDLATTSLPFPRNGLFVGREDELRSLEHFIDSSTPHRMTVCGLGGCGKSALALELAYRALVRRAERPVFWVPAINRQSFELAFRDIGIHLRVPGITKDNADIKQLIKDTLSSDGVGHWLMIVDNADDTRILADGTGVDARSARLQDYLPHSNSGKILFTTRSRKAAEELTPSYVLKLNDMSKAEVRELLVQRISKPASFYKEEDIDQLLKLLERLPLAIIQAAAFINSNNISISEYLSLFRTAGTETELFSEHFEDPSRYIELESTIARTWHISFDQIQKQDPLAAEYLAFMACIDRINVPRSLLPPSDSVLQQTKAIGTLKGYAFITERQQASQELGSEKYFDMHRLVHIASAWWLESHGKQPTWIARAAGRLKELIPNGGHEKKEVWTAYLSHAIHVTRSDSVLDKTEKAWLLNRVGECQNSLGQYAAAETIHRQALLLREGSLWNEHPDTLTSMNNLADVLDSQGKYEEAESMNRQTLVRREKVLGPEHSDTLMSMNNLAVVLDNQGKYKEAESMNRQTLVRREKVLGPEHPDTLTSMNNLALVLDNQGKYKEAGSINRQTLARREKVLGREHPDTLISMNNLAVVLDNQGKYKEAESMNRQTLVRREKVLGPEHPDTLMSMSNLAVVLDSQGKYEEAESMNRQTLALREKILGREHPYTLLSMNNLALVLERQGKYKEAESIHRQELAMCEKVLGREHPDALMSMSNLAFVLDSQGKYEEAESINRQTLARREKVIGREHPDTLTSVYCLAHLFANQHRYAESRALYERACAGYITVLGEDHPTTRSCHQHYYEMLASQEHDQSAISSTMPTTTVANIPNKKRYKLSRGLYKIGIRIPKFSP